MMEYTLKEESFMELFAVNCEKLFEKIDELYPAYVKVWEDICNIESPTNYKAGVDEVCKYIIKMAQERKWHIEISKQDISGDAACITINPDAEKAAVCISGHIDTVHPVGLFGKRAVSMDEEKIYGPGVMDCKGGVVAGLLAMDALSQVGFTARPIKLIIQSDEETGSKTSGKKTVEFMCDKAKGAVAFLNTEGSETGKVTLIRKGILRCHFNIKGKAVHSAACYEGANAVCEAAHKIIELEKMKDKDGITCNCGVIEGGTVANTVAERCSFLADIRYATQEQKNLAIEAVKRISENITVKGCSCELEIFSERPPMEKADRNFELFNTMNEIYVQCGLETVEHIARNGGSDAAYITQMGVPCVDNIGVMGGRIHSPQEFAYISSLALSAKRIAAVVYCI